MRYRCAVYGCDTVIKARHLCRSHYVAWRHRRVLPPHGDQAGMLMHGDETSATVFVCDCSVPDPTPIGMCARCGMLVATFVHDDGELRAVYRQRYPVQYQRAEALGLGRA